MIKIPFDIKHRPQIESGEYKVILDCGVEAEILAWDKPGEYPIVCMAKKEGAIPFRTNNNGKAYHFPEGANYSDLFIVTSEEEMTEFEIALENFVMNADASEQTFHEDVKQHAAELLAIARKELIKEGTSKNEIGTMLYDAGFEDGKAEAFMELPRWKELPDGIMNQLHLMDKSIIVNHHYILFSDLEKLLGFNE